MAEAVLSFDNPVFAQFAFYAAIAFIKLILMSPLTVKNRVGKKVFANQEDVDAFAADKKDAKPTLTDPDVERIRRAHLNDIENVIPFILIGPLYVLTGPTAFYAALHFRVFVVARLLHTITYMLKLQPYRFLFCIVGWCVNLSMALTVLMSGRF